MSPRRRRSQPKSRPQPGWVAFADTWPDWEHQGAPAPHPIIVVKTASDHRVMVLPISTKELGHIHVPLCRDDYPTIFANDVPLSETCAIVIADKFGDRTNVWGTINNNQLNLGSISILLRNGKQLSADEWNKLKDLIAAAGNNLR